MTAINLPSIDLVRERAAVTSQVTLHPAVGEAEASRFLSIGAAIAAILLGAAIAINDGRLHWLGMQWLTIGLLAGVAAMLLCRSRGACGVRVGLIETILGVGVMFQLAHLAMCGVQMSAGSNLPAGALHACVAAMALGVLLAWRTRRVAAGTVLVIGGFAVAAFACLWTHPDVKIDVLMFQRESAGALLAGQHPYDVRYRDVYGGASDFYGPGASVGGWLTYSFPYPPVSLLLVLPGQLFGDVRYAHAAAIVAAAGLIVAAGRNRLAVLAAALLLTSPRTLFVVQTGWTEPLLILLGAGTMFCALRCRGATWFSLGLWIAAKQYMILVLPLLRLIGPAMGSRRAWRQTILAAVLLAAAITIPFAATQPVGFFRSVAAWQFAQPFRHDALSFPAMLAQIAPTLDPADLGRASIPLLAALLAILLAWWKAPRTPGGLMAASAIVLACFFCFSKQGFCNYYLLVIGLLCCAIAGLNARRTEILSPGTRLGPGLSGGYIPQSEMPVMLRRARR